MEQDEGARVLPLFSPFKFMTRVSFQLFHFFGVLFHFKKPRKPLKTLASLFLLEQVEQVEQ